MQDLNQLQGHSFQEGLFYLGLSTEDFNYVNDDGIKEVSYEITDIDCDNNVTVYLITFTITEEVENINDEDEIEANLSVNPDTFDYVGYWHFVELCAMKHIATIKSEEEFKIYLKGTQLVTEDEKEIPDGNFEHKPTDQECVERVYNSYDGDSFEIIDCIEYN